MDNMDFLKVTDMLSKSFWSPDIGIEEVKKGARHSALVVGAFEQNFGFKPMVTPELWMEIRNERPKR